VLFLNRWLGALHLISNVSGLSVFTHKCQTQPWLLSPRCAGIFHCYMEYAALKGEAGANVTIQELGFQVDFTVYLQIRQTWLAFSQYTALPLPQPFRFCPPPPSSPSDLYLCDPSPSLVIILAIMEVIIILLLIFLRKRILIAIALIKEASRSDFTGGRGPISGWEM